MKKKIKTTNYDGTIIEVEVNINVYNYDKENYWQEDWRNRKAKQEDSYEEMCNFYQKNGLPPELQEESSEIKYIRNYEYEELHRAIDKLPKTQRRRIILRYFHGLTLKQISDLEKVNINSIQKSINKALIKLRTLSNDFWNLGV